MTAVATSRRPTALKRRRIFANAVQMINDGNRPTA
jgi:hypothetical protein